MKETQRFANEAEEFVANRLVDRGCWILSRNFRRRGTELDIVACRQQNIYVVEVKHRKKKIEYAFEVQMMLGRRKILALKRGCDLFRRDLNLHPHTIRFDLAVVTGRPEQFTLQYYPNIFQY